VGRLNTKKPANIDLSDRKQAEIALRIRDAAIASSINAIAFTDINGILTYVNRSFLTLWGYAHEHDVLGRSALSFWHFPEQVEEVKDALRRVGSWVGELVAERKDGTLFNVELSASVIVDEAGRPLCMMASFIDVTQRRRAETALEEREIKFRSLFEMMNEGVAIHELVLDDSGQAVDYRILDVNPAYEKITGILAGKARGKRGTELYGTAEAPYLDIFAPIALAGGHCEFDTYFPPMDKHFRISVFSPRPGEFATIFIDITSRKRDEEALRRSEELLRLFIKHSPLATAILDDHGGITYLNDRFVELFGYSLEDIPDQAAWLMRAYPDEYYRREMKTVWQDAMDKADREGTSIGRHEYRVTCKDGTERTVEIFGTAIDGRKLVLLNDITEQKIALQQIEILNTALAARAAELENANRELDAFSHTVSHDLRTPLTNISGYTQLMQELYDDRLDGQGHDFLREINAATERMGKMIDALLKFSAVSRQGLQRVRVDLNAIAADVITELQLTAPQRRVQFISLNRALVQGDPVLLRVVMANLLGNAWKYSAKREATVIKFGTTDRNGQTVYFVRDNGVGFDKKLADKIFTPFHRLHKDMDFEGSGIGLATAQRIIQRHGGEIWAKGEVDKGATFYFTLGSN